MNKWISILIGLILLIAPIYTALNFPAWGQATLDFIQGGLVVLVAIIGIALIILGISDLKD